MKTYELTYIISPAMTLEEGDSVKSKVESFLQNNGGIILKSEKMGAQPLSYAILKQNSGYFNLLVFQIEENKIKEIKGNLDKNAEILRSLIIIKKPVKEIKGRRARRTMAISEFEIRKKPSIMEPIMKEEKREEKVDDIDLNKKLDELLSK